MRKLRKKFRGSDGLRTNMIVRSRRGRARRTRAARTESGRVRNLGQHGAALHLGSADARTRRRPAGVLKSAKGAIFDDEPKS